MSELPVRIPVSTYRLQLNAAFTFRDACGLAPYLTALGISDCYVSPILAAGSGSTHGYDICDYGRLNPELGGWADFESFCGALKQHGMGLIMDLVPNHMGIDPSLNLAWRSVLENGPSSPFARFFDIDWDPVKPELKNKVLLPILGDQYGTVLEAGQLQIHFENGAFSVRYFDMDLPLNPRQMRGLLRHRLDELRQNSPDEDTHLRELLSILFHLDHIPAYNETAPGAVVDRSRENVVVRERLAALVGNSEKIRRHVEENVREFNGTPGRPETFDRLHDLLELQPYRLSYWRTAVHEINYRRFFDINELAAIRMEDPVVFDAAHSLVKRLVASGLVTGLRVDHVDGLYDPGQYLLALRRGVAAAGGPIYLVVEKILSEGERLPGDWPVEGTTGYDFLNDVAGLFVDSGKTAEILKLYARFTRRPAQFGDIAYDSKKVIVSGSMAGELNVLAHELNRISESNRRSRDFTLDSLQDGLREVVACFPVYRTYFSGGEISEFDRNVVRRSVQRALRKNRALDPSMFAFIENMLLPDRGQRPMEEEYGRRVRFAMKFQQYTGPVQAKGVEDTAFYRFGPLLSLNEVGGDPSRFGRSPEEFHRSNRRRRNDWPLTMLSTATHDTKRGEDARARISVLSEIPDEFRAALARWARLNSGSKTDVYGDPAPDRADEYFFYQTLIGAWPAEAVREVPEDFIGRMRKYLQKATKEAKVHTSWIHPFPEYDEAVADFVASTLAGPRSQRFLEAFVPFQEKVARAGVSNSLAQLVLKAASPGVPDFYQGCELWDLNLVDPDNRRDVDFALRRRCLDGVLPLLGNEISPQRRAESIREMLFQWKDGRIKLFCTAAALQLRRRITDVFQFGDYVPLPANGRGKDHVVAFGRRRGSRSVIAIASRLTARSVTNQHPFPLGECFWEDTAIESPPEWSLLSHTDVFTKRKLGPGRLLLRQALESLPVALLAGDSA